MDIIFSLTLRYLKQNKKKTISVISGIVVASMLLTMTSLYMSSYLEKLETLEVLANELAPLMKVSFVVMAVILSVLVIFIYNMLNISAKNKARYLGMLATVGATPFQRSKMILLEAILVGLIGIPIGITFGFLLSFTIFPFPIIISRKMLLTASLCEFVIILLSGVIPAWQSGKCNIIELIQNKTEKRKFKHPVQLPKWILTRFGAESHFAVKNLVFFKHRYRIIGGSIALSMVLFLDGFIILNYIDGHYEIKDLREKNQADFTITEEIYNQAEHWNEFVSEIITLPDVKEYAIREKAEFDGILIDKKNIHHDFQSFSSYMLAAPYSNPTTIYDKNGKTKQGYCMDMVLVGLDEQTFKHYLKQTGFSTNIPENSNAIPVLIEDYPLVRKKHNTKYQSILDIKEGALLSVFGTPNQFMTGASPESNPVKAFEKWEFQVLGTTSQTPPCYDIWNVLLHEQNTLFFYTDQTNFERFLKEHPLEETEHSVSFRVKSKVPDLRETVLQKVVIQNGNTFYRRLKLASSSLTMLSNEEMQKNLKIRKQETEALENAVEEIGKKYQVVSIRNGTDSDHWNYFTDSYVQTVLWQLADPMPLIIHLFVYGLLIFITIICIFQVIKMILSSMQLRRQEFAVFLSLGMSKKQIGKMVCIENLICVTGSFLIGIVISVSAALAGVSILQQNQALTFKFPYQIILIEMIFLVFLILLSVCISMRSVKNIEILDIVRTETI